MSMHTPKRPRIRFDPDESLKKLRLQNSLQKQREQLPIAKGKDALIREIRDNDVTVLLGETGSGKTTQVPQYLLEAGLAGNGMVAVTQPRRVAATSLAARVAAEQNVTVGSLVGYSVRFDEAWQAQTKIKYVSDGMLVRELLSDPMLSRYSVIILDEAHERTLRTDFLITNLKTILAKRNVLDDKKGKSKNPPSGSNPLKVIIMSATLDAEKFSRFYNNARILYIKGRQHPVQIFHTAASQVDYIDAALRTFFQIHVDKPPGDVLIFLPGQEDIESLERSLSMCVKRLPIEQMNVTVCPMYASLPPSQQARIFSPTPPNTRKCILATNIAETSITIPGIKYVIDTGKCKEKRYLTRETGSGFDTLLTRDITKSSAMQRAGRAGREGPGFCFRLYTEEAFSKLAISVEPEIRRCSLTQSALQLKCLGQNLEEVEFMDPPDTQSVYTALKSLWLLDALDNSKTLTTLGRQMAIFPIEPYLARIILASKTHGCTFEVIDIVSLLSSSSNLFLDISDQRDAITDARRKFRHPSGDHLTMLNALRSYQDIASNESKSERRDWCRKHYLNERTFMEALKIRDQLRATCQRVGLDWRTSGSDVEEPVLRCFTAGLMQHSALLQPDGSYKQLMGQFVVKIHPGSALCDKKVPAIIFDELVRAYESDLCTRGLLDTTKFPQWYHADNLCGVMPRAILRVVADLPIGTIDVYLAHALAPQSERVFFITWPARPAMTNADKVEELAQSIPGNASIVVKGLIWRLLDMFSNCGFGIQVTQRLNLTEVSIVQNANEPTKEEARVVLEITVTEDMVNPSGKMHGGCTAHLVDICTTLPIAAMSFAKGRSGSVGVSQSINIIYHAPASLGDKLRLINTSTTVGTRLWSARIEVWNVTHHRLVASATQTKMEASAPKL